MQIRIDKNNSRYDNWHDVLHVFLIPSKPYYGDEDFPGIIFNRALDGSTIGLVILDFVKLGMERLDRYLPGFDFSNALERSGELDT